MFASFSSVPSKSCCSRSRTVYSCSPMLLAVGTMDTADLPRVHAASTEPPNDAAAMPPRNDRRLMSASFTTPPLWRRLRFVLLSVGLELLGVLALHAHECNRLD